tara:strand:+ start:2035 stop:2274 length:240 start_codon:yes stop_codon:yes gene_type:complete
MLLLDDFDDAVMGSTLLDDELVLCYDITKCLDILISQGMTPDQAQEYFEYNILDAYMGKDTPIFIDTNFFIDGITGTLQ